MTLFVPAGTPQVLPDPTTVPGEAFTIIDGDDTDTVYTSSGPPLPFSVNGVLAATYTAPGGSFRSLRSVGGVWVVDPGTGGAAGTKGYRATAVSDAAGNAVFNMSAAAFLAAPIVVPAVQAAESNNPIDYRVTALTASSCTVHVRQSPVLVILSLSVLGVSAPLAGVTVQLHAFAAGSQS